MEAVPLSLLAASTKADWTPDPDGLLSHAESVAEKALATLSAHGISDQPSTASGYRLSSSEDTASGQKACLEPGCRLGLRSLPPQTAKLLIKDSISALPLHKVLVLLESLGSEHDEAFAAHEKLALACILPTEAGNLRFGPEVGVGTVKHDAPVVSSWLARMHTISDDLRLLAPMNGTPAAVLHGDARTVHRYFEPASIDAVITSPPYPNEKDYSRTVRLESVLLGFLNDRADLQAMKRTLLRSNTRGVYKGDDDDKWINSDPEVQRIADAIESRRVELGKQSGFERAYHRVTRLYFGGMARHLTSLSRVLKPGARLAYVVGDQASYLKVMIRTGRLLAGIAERCGYEVESIDLFRTRKATATRQELREEVLLLRWPGATTTSHTPHPR